jgi:hypothetical protein
VLRCVRALRQEGVVQRAVVHTGVGGEGVPDGETPVRVALDALARVPADAIAVTLPAFALSGGGGRVQGEPLEDDMDGGPALVLVD